MTPAEWIAAAVKVLREVETAAATGDDRWPCCPVCMGEEHPGNALIVLHAADCDLARLLRAVPS